MARQNHIFRKIRKGSQAEKLADVLIERPVSSGVRSINTVGALAQAGMGLQIDCTACGETARHAAKDIVTTFGEDTSLAEVRPACPACGATSVSVMPVSG